MAVTLVGAGSAAANSSFSTTLNVPYPTGLAADDLLVLVVGSADFTSATNPAGWTSQVSTNAQPNNAPGILIATKKAVGTETGSLVVTTPNNTSQGRMWAFRGVDPATAMDVAASPFRSSGVVTAFDIPGLTTTQVGVCLFYGAACETTGGSWTPPTVPATFTEDWDSSTPPSEMTAGHLIWSGSGATGTINLVVSAAQRGSAGLLALRPAPPPHHPAATARLVGVAAESRTRVPVTA